MSFTRGVWIVVKKETRDFFMSPLVYILTALFSLSVGWLFFNYVIAAGQLTQQTLSKLVLTPIFGNMNFIFLFFSPLITMRVFAEERKIHTLEALLLSDLSELQIVLAKFLSSLGVALFMILSTAIFPIILSLSGYSEWAIVATSYLGLILSIGCYLAVGVFASSLTDSQMISAVISFCLLLGLMLFSLTGQVIDNVIVSQIFRYLSISFHYEYFVSGSLLSYSVIFFMSFIFFFLYLCLLSLKSRKW